ncbi:MAG TPA: lysoplasmalogenase [Thermoanaerobaculia bacterium]|nr:lysoplasmalogenase [Thermoanaerobaculia bacterium]
MLIWILLTAFALIWLLVAEARSFRGGVLFFKPLASAGFVAVALALGAPFSRYSEVLLLAFLLCWLGDVLLMFDRFFLAGLVSFVLAHVAFGAAFALRGQSVPWAMASLAILAVAAGVIVRWLRPHLPSDMRIPVYFYVGAITVMVALAAGAVAAGSPWVILAGAAAFYLSDLSVANDRFVHERFLNKLWGLSLYYAAQILLAASVRK